MNNVKRIAIKITLLSVFILFSNNYVFSQLVFDHTETNGSDTNYDTTWTVPPNVTSITIQAWGGGGGGNGNASIPDDAKVGGGGGFYSKVENIGVTEGQVLQISIGHGGKVLESGGFSNTGQPGGISTVRRGSETLISACGGTYMYVIAGWYQEGPILCQQDSSSLGLIEKGEYPYFTSRLDASIKGGNAGGLAEGGGVGGSEGQLGTVPGGGGGGGLSNNSKAGAAGRVIITEGNLLPVCEINVIPSSNSVCKGDSIVITASGMSEYQWSPAISLSSNIGSVVFAFPNESTTYKVIGSKDNCVDSTLISINVEEKPVANFSYEYLEGTSYLFTNIGSNSNSTLWDFGDGNTSTDENPEHAFEQEGEFTVKLIIENNCGVDTAMHNIVVVKLNTSKIQQNLFKLYPNPASGYLIIESMAQGNAYLQIINNLGQVVHEKSYHLDNISSVIDISGINSGLYYLRIVTEQIDVIKKFMISNE